MGKLLVPILFVLLAGGVFFMYIDPTYQNIQKLQEQSGRLDEALQKARELRAAREELLTRYNTFSAEDLARLQKLLPDNVENVRLILDIDAIAAGYDLIIRDFGFSADAFTDQSSGPGPGPSNENRTSRDYRSITMEFSTIASYEDFMAFLSDLERSLRVVDASSVNIETTDDGEYNYRVSIRTYWLK